MPSHDEPVLRTELPALGPDFVATLARGAAPASALAHCLDRIRQQNQADPSPFAGAGHPPSSDFGSAIG